jgi:hypothetical protein
MIIMRANSPKRRRARPLEAESGIALILVLFLLITMTILGLTMVASVNSDMMVNGYYGNARAAYYAADSGMNIVRQYMQNQLIAQVSTHACLGWGSSAGDPLCQSAPLPCNSVADCVAAGNALANMRSTFSAYSSGALNAASTPAASSWPSSFIIPPDNPPACQTALTLASNPVLTPSKIPGSTLTGEYTYTFNYSICAVGTAAATSTQHAAVQESGTFTLQVPATDYPAPTFAGYGQFVSNQNACPGSYLTPGTYTGPSYTNGAWTLGSNSPYIFTGKLSSVNPDIWCYDSKGCQGSSTLPLPGCNASFPGGIQLSAPALTPPTNTYSQAWAVLDGQGLETTFPTNAQLNAELKTVSGTAYPTSGSATGVYLPWYTDPHTGSTNFGYLASDGTTQEPAGGVFIQGNASIVMSATFDTSTPPNPTQTFTITQGSTVTTIVTNQTTNTTTFSSGSTTQTLKGIPQNLGAIPGQAVPGTMVYVNGTVTGLTGPSNSSNPTHDTVTSTSGSTNPIQYAAIQNNSMVTVAGSGDIHITGNILYANEPVTRDANDTLLLTQSTNPAQPTNTQLFGAFTANGAIILSTPYTDTQNLEIDGSLAAIGTNANCGSSTCGFKSANHINTWNNVGGQIQSNEFVCDINTANTFYDQRLSQWTNFFPPWFPSTQTGATGWVAAAPKPTSSQARTRWSWVAQ